MTRLEQTLDGKELPKNVVLLACLFRLDRASPPFASAMAIGRSGSAMVGVRTPSISSVR